MTKQSRPFGQMEGREIPLLTLKNETMAVELLPLGAAVRSLWVPDKGGNPTDVVLGYESLEEYRELDGCLGGTLGRCANRIGGARFAIGGREYRLTANEGANTLHGGAVGFHKRLWDWEAGEEQVTFTLLSPDGEEGFPGNLQVQVRYTLAGSALVMDYRAKSDRDTVVNLSGHSYFNLAGHSGGRVEEHRLTLHAKEYTPAGPDNVPLGVLSPVAGTPLDFCAETPLGERMGDPFLQAAGGFDHNFALEGGHTGEAKSGAEVWCPRTGIALELRTTLPGLQLYTAGFLTPRRGKEGAVYAPGHAVCLEAQHFPDGINHPAFPSPLLRAGEEYQEQTVYRFSVR